MTGSGHELRQVALAGDALLPFLKRPSSTPSGTQRMGPMVGILASEPQGILRGP